MQSKASTKQRYSSQGTLCALSPRSAGKRRVLEKRLVQIAWTVSGLVDRVRDAYSRTSPGSPFTREAPRAAATFRRLERGPCSPLLQTVRQLAYPPPGAAPHPTALDRRRLKDGHRGTSQEMHRTRRRSALCQRGGRRGLVIASRMAQGRRSRNRLIDAPQGRSAAMALLLRSCAHPRLAETSGWRTGMDSADCEPSSSRESGPGVKPLHLWERFEWETGSCFRCDRLGVEVAVIGTITAGGIDVGIHACRACVFHLEQMHWMLVMRESDGSSGTEPRSGPVFSSETRAGPVMSTVRSEPASPQRGGWASPAPGERPLRQAQAARPSGRHRQQCPTTRN